MKVMIIRHAEKPSKDGLVHGVTHIGEHDRHALSVRGWQRAGALVRFFAPLNPRPADSLIATPRSIFASAATAQSPSLRALHTVEPLAAALGLPVRAPFPEGGEKALAATVRASEGPALIAWHHKTMPTLARAIAGQGIDCPDLWPDDRFDVVWILDDIGHGAWRFAQVAQRLLPHDSADTIIREHSEDMRRSRSG
jgi:broad specificity phosphatase PhoE